MILELNISFDEAMIEKLQRIPFQLVLGPAERVLRAMAKPVAAKALAIAPSSRRSGERNRWGKKYKNNPSYQNDSGKAIGFKLLKHNNGGVLIIGTLHPEGNKQNYDAGESRTVKLWGRDPVKYPIKEKRIDPKDRFMQRAYDETRDQQLSAGHAQLVKEIEELKIG
jgi:hypothetical protein